MILKEMYFAFSRIKRPGFFIFVDMLIALTISSICLMMIYKGVQRIEAYKIQTDDLVVQRNRITEILTSKDYYVQTNNLEKDRSYEIFPGVFVDIYHVDFDEDAQRKFGLEKIEFGIVEERKGE